MLCREARLSIVGTKEMGHAQTIHCRKQPFIARIVKGRADRSTADKGQTNSSWNPRLLPRTTFPSTTSIQNHLSLRVRVTLAADRKSVDPVVQQVMDAIHDVKCVDGKEDAIELALQEALANALFTAPRKIPAKLSSAWWLATISAECSSLCAIPGKVSIHREFRRAPWARISTPTTAAESF